MANFDDVSFTEMTYTEGAAPATPSAGDRKIYAKSDGIYEIDDAGTETGPFGTGGSGGGDQPITLSAGALAEVLPGGTATSLGQMNNWHAAWIFDTVENTSVGGQVRIPSGWSTVDVVCVWANDSANSGDVNLRLLHDTYDQGDTLADTAETAVTPTAGAQHVVQETTLKSGLVVTAGEQLMVDVQRRPGEGTDTLSGNIGILALVIVKAS